MATIAKRKQQRRNPLGLPPSADEARNNLQEPEAAPAAQPAAKPAQTQKKAVKPQKGRAVSKPRSTASEEVIDGRTLRRTGRTEQFATRVRPDFKKSLHSVAQATGKNYNVILEESLELYRQKINV